MANAILDGADACMLSGETAIGQFPVETVEMMSRVMQATEQLLLHRADLIPPVPALTGVHPITGATVKGAVEIARQLHASMMVIATHRGATVTRRTVRGNSDDGAVRRIVQIRAPRRPRRGKQERPAG